MSIGSEEITVNYVVNRKAFYSMMSANWEKNGHPVGLWIKYYPKVSHQYAFAILSQGVWKALQSPDDYNIDAALYEEQPGRQPPPYMVLREEI